MHTHHLLQLHEEGGDGWEIRVWALVAASAWGTGVCAALTAPLTL